MRNYIKFCALTFSLAQEVGGVWQPGFPYTLLAADLDSAYELLDEFLANLNDGQPEGFGYRSDGDDGGQDWFQKLSKKRLVRLLTIQSTYWKSDLLGFYAEQLKFARTDDIFVDKSPRGRK